MENTDEPEQQDTTAPVETHTGPECGICFLAFEPTDKISQSPACECSYHSGCALDFASRRFYNGHNHIHCPNCHSVLWEIETLSHNSPDTEEQNIAAQAALLQENPQFRADLKTLRQKKTLKSKALGLFKRDLREVGNQYKLATALHIHAIKEERKAATQAIKSKDSYKTLNRLTTGLKLAQGRFVKKYELNRDMQLHFFPRMSWWQRRSTVPTTMIRRRFRIALY